MSNEMILKPERGEMLAVLGSSFYPGAAPASIELVLNYCTAAGLDPMTKPVHIVPMWDGKARSMRDVIMPGIGLYRTQAARSGCAGISEPEFGPEDTKTLSGMEFTFPSWCRVTVKRRLASGEIVDFTAIERWIENYAVKGGQEKSLAPNAMWLKRPYGQLAKCAEAQALRKAFPEIGAQPTAEEMQGKALYEDDGMTIDGATGEIVGQKPAVKTPQRRAPKAETFDEIQRAEDAPEDDEPEQKKPAARVADKAPAEEPAGNGALASEGERNWILAKLKRKDMSVADAREAAGLSPADTLDGLTKDGWAALRDVVK